MSSVVGWGPSGDIMEEAHVHDSESELADEPRQANDRGHGRLIEFGVNHQGKMYKADITVKVMTYL